MYGCMLYKGTKIRAEIRLRWELGGGECVRTECVRRPGKHENAGTEMGGVGITHKVEEGCLRNPTKVDLKGRSHLRRRLSIHL